MPVFEACGVDNRTMTVGLVNIMPDAAFIDTEDQSRRLVAAGGHDAPIDLKLYTITEIPRSEAITAVIEERYAGLDQLWRNAPDALIVTGTEPAQAQLSYEPYWPYLARLLEWAADSVPTMLLSCLASQAYVLLFDGIERVPRRVKCSGVFAGAVEDPDDPLAIGLPERVPVPHSRANDIPEAALLDAGYRIVVGSGPAAIGWSVAARNSGDGLLVLCQGHPEYSTLSLLREYRRDVHRHLFGRGVLPYPDLPEGYLRPEAAARMEEFAWRVGAPGADPRELWAGFPGEAVAHGIENTWAAASKTIYANWLRTARAESPISDPHRD